MDQELKDILLSMQSEIRSIHTEMSEMKQTQQQQGQEIAKINMTLEHNISKQLELLGEGRAAGQRQHETEDEGKELGLHGSLSFPVRMVRYRSRHPAPEGAGRHG